MMSETEIVAALKKCSSVIVWASGLHVYVKISKVEAKRAIRDSLNQGYPSFDVILYDNVLAIG